jgi:hypothetical protein
MLEKLTPLHLFVDADKLDAVINEQSPESIELLKQSKAQKIQIIVSEIALRESNARKRDNILRDVRNLNAAITKLKNTVQYSSLLSSDEIAQFGYQFQSFNYEGLQSHLNDAAERQFTLLSQQYNILTVPVTPEHTERLLNKYFNRLPPFDTQKEEYVQPEQEKKERETASNNRRKHIPDAWIIEAAIELKEQGHRLLVLAKDYNLRRTLEIHGIEHVENPADALAKISESSNSVSNNELDHTPANIANLSDHNELHQRVLATVYLLSADAPVSKVNLIEFLKEFYTPDKIIATADYLAAVQEVLKKIGDGYVPRDKHLCKEAYDNRLLEILRIMSRGQ